MPANQESGDLKFFSFFIGECFLKSIPNLAIFNEEIILSVLYILCNYEKKIKENKTPKKREKKEKTN